MQCKPLLLLAPLVFTSTAIAANAIPTPELYGDVQGNLRWEDNHDYQSEINLATLGLLGKHKAGPVLVRYNLEAEYGQKLTERNPEDQDFDIRLSEANLILINKQYGSIYFGNGTTGTYKDLYSKVDLFQSNNMHSSSDASLYRQGHTGTNQLAYATPFWNGFQFKGAVISPSDNNGEDVDIHGLRLIYRQEKFGVVLNRSQIDQKQLPASITKDYVRYALASHYQLDNIFIGGLIELNQDDPQGDSTVYGASGEYTFDQLSFKLGAQFKLFDDSDKKNDSLYLANVSYHFDDYFASYLEVAEYKHDSKNDNITLGLNFTF